MLTYLSFGAGAESSALVVMSVLGLRGCPKASVAIFADTQGEAAWVYPQLALMSAWARARGVPVHVVTRGKLAEDDTVRIPAFVEGKEGSAPLTRNCTRDYKTTPIRRAARRLMRATGERAAQCLMGISLDEAHRMKDSRVQWLTHVYPLVDARMTRSACAELLEAHGLPVPMKSACAYCPFHSDQSWRDVRDHDPAGWQAAIAYDAKLRATRGASLHRSMIPLALVPLGVSQVSMFGNECEGHCGV